MTDTGYVVPSPSLSAALADAWRARGVLWSLTLREVQVRYRQALLGILWALAQPLALVAVATVVFHRFLGVEAGRGPYWLEAYVGLLVWTYVHTAISSAVPSLVQNASLVRKIWFWREALPLAAVLAALLDLLVGAGIWLVMLLLTGRPVGVVLLWAAPLTLLLVLACAGPALLGAALNVAFRDVKHALPLLLQVLFFATPIVYPFAAVPPRLRGAFAANPLVAVIEGLRRAAFEERGPGPELLLPALGTTALLLVGGILVFRRASRRFADLI